MTPQRIQLRRARGWRLPDGAVVVGRPTPWGNPFVAGRDGTAADCVNAYTMLLAGYLHLTSSAPAAVQTAARRHVLDHIGELQGRDLACWCRPGTPCHADVLLRLARFWPRKPALWPCVDRQGRARILLYPPDLPGP